MSVRDQSSTVSNRSVSQKSVKHSVKQECQSEISQAQPPVELAIILVIGANEKNNEFTRLNERISNKACTRNTEGKKPFNTCAGYLGQHSLDSNRKHEVRFE